jgi:hypothetical protein
MRFMSQWQEWTVGWAGFAILCDVGGFSLGFSALSAKIF